MNCLFIYNPLSGKGKVKRKLDYIVNKLHKVYDTVDVYESTSGDNIKDIVKSVGSKYDSLIFSGGDGTFNHVCQGVCELDKKPILGFIPTGTANDNARNLKIPISIRGSLRVILGQKVISHDVGRVNGDTYFMYVCALGACTGTPYTTRQEAKKILGKLAYIQNGLDEFFSPIVNDVTIRCNGKSIKTKCPLLLVMNTITVGGIPFNRYGHLNDGLFDVVLVNDGYGHGRFNIIKFFIRGIFGFRRKRNAVYVKSKYIEVDTDDDLTWDIDGERGPKGNIKIECLEKYLKIYVPKRKK